MPTLSNLHAFQSLNESWSNIFTSLQPEAGLQAMGGPQPPASMMADPVAGSLAPLASLPALPGLGMVDPGTSGGSGLVTFETIQGVLDNVEANPLLRASLHPDSLGYAEIGCFPRTLPPHTSPFVGSPRAWSSKWKRRLPRASIGSPAGTFPTWLRPSTSLCALGTSCRAWTCAICPW